MLQGLTLTIIFLVIIGATIGIGAKVVSNIGDSVATTKVIGVSNETISTSDGSGSTLANQPGVGPITSIQSGSDVIVNTTDGTLVNNTGGALNYTINYNNGTIIWFGNSTYNGTDVKITYNFIEDEKSIPRNVTDDTLSGLGEISGFMPTIALAIVAIVILTLLIGGLAIFIKRRL